MNFSDYKGALTATVAGLIVVAGMIGAAYLTKNRPAEPPITVDAESASADQTASEANPKAVIKTAAGDIELELFPKAAPKTVANFIKLTKDGFYNGTTFHRVVPDFVVQGGDPNSKDADPTNDGQGGPGYQFEDEINPKALGLSDEAIKILESQGYKYDFSLASLNITTGALAMANSGPNTNGSQFFIVIGPDQSHLDGKHTVFGRVTNGFETAKKIAPNEVMTSVSIIE